MRGGGQIVSGKICRGIVLHGGAYDQIIPKGEEFHNCIIQQSEQLKSVEYLLEDKALTIL